MGKSLSISATQPRPDDIEGAQVLSEPPRESILTYQLPRESIISYQLPPVVESMRSRWLSTFGSAATIFSLLAAAQASLVAFFTDDKNFKSPQQGVQKAALILTYAAIILTISATISALTLTDELGTIPGRASRDPLHTTHPVRCIEGNSWDILRYFGARKSMRWVTYHWLTCLILAILCTLASITLYASTQGTQALVIVSIITCAAILPPLCHVIARSSS